MPPDSTDQHLDLLDGAAAGPAAIRGSVLRVAVYAIGLALALVSMPLLVRHLGQAAFGEYFTVISLAAVVSGLTEGGIGVLATREFTTTTGREREQVLGILLGIRLSLSIAGGAVIILFAWLVGYSSPMVLGTLVAAAGMVIQTLQAVFAVPLQGGLRLGSVAAVDLARQFVSVGLIIVLVLLGAGIVPLLAVSIPAAVVSLLLTIAFVRRIALYRPRLEFARWGPLLREAGLLGVAVAVNTLYFRVAVVGMSLLGTPIETGYFSTAFQFVAVMLAVPALTIASVFPILVRAGGRDGERLWSASTRLIELALLTGGAIMVLLQTGSSLVIAIVGGASAAPAAPVLAVLAVSVLATFMTYAATTVLTSIGRYRALLVINLLGLVVSSLLLAALIPRYQAIGAAFAVSASECVLAVLSVAILRSSGVESRLPWRPLAKIGAVLAGSLIAGVVLSGHDFLAPVVSGALLIVGVLVTGLLPPELVHALDLRAYFRRAGQV